MIFFCSQGKVWEFAVSDIESETAQTSLNYDLREKAMIITKDDRGNCTLS